VGELCTFLEWTFPLLKVLRDSLFSAWTRSCISFEILLEDAWTYVCVVFSMVLFWQARFKGPGLGVGSIQSQKPKSLEACFRGTLRKRQKP